MKIEKKVNYGDSITDNLLGPFLINGKSIRISLNYFKKQLKNPRKQLIF